MTAGLRTIDEKGEIRRLLEKAAEGLVHAIGHPREPSQGKDSGQAMLCGLHGPWESTGRWPVFEQALSQLTGTTLVTAGKAKAKGADGQAFRNGRVS